MGLLNFLTRRKPELDLPYAAKGFVQVMIARRYSPNIDLHQLELGYAGELLSQGCTRQQALSARWGGVYAISSSVDDFDCALHAYKETMAEMLGKSGFETKEEAERAYLAAATLVLGKVIAVDPAEYGRFLKYINA